MSGRGVISYGTIVVGTDGSESSLLAVDRAGELAATAKALLIVVCAYHPMTAREQAIASPSLGDTRFDQVLGTAAAEKALDDGSQHAAAAGATGVQVRMAAGDAATALVEVATDSSADLIVVGNRGISSLTGRVLGSVPASVSQRAPCDVLIVHTT
jgi:nucleotide-binding universal stress UspA family protein